MKEDLEEIFTQDNEKPLKQILKRGWMIGVGVVVGIYVYFLFYGDNSIGVYSKLIKEKQQIENQVSSLQNENVELQKVIFELRGLEPNLEEKK